DNDNKGVSLTLLNTKKSKEIFDIINSSFTYKDVTSIKPSSGGIGGNMPIFFSRKYFFDNLENEYLEKLYKNSKDPKYNIAIVNMMFQNNFGGVLTYYALFNVIKNIGYNPILIYNSYGNNGLYDNVMGCKTALKYLNVGNEVFSKEELQKYVDKCDTFIVGSDQVWRYDFFLDNIFYYLLNFVPNSKKKISYSSSFGIDTYNGNKENKVLFKNYLNQFDYVSVREDTGVDICKNEFYIDAVHTLDPVLLLESKDYDYLISKSKLKIDYDYIAVYNLRSDLNNIINTISDKLKLKVITINFNYSVEAWLYIIKNSKYLITDSFHGICFAIIFNIPFVITLNEEAGISRILSISKQFNFEDRIIKDINEITDKKLNNIINMDFTEINNKLK
ncbi:polysaccharide pyruvyl transferase family protein, partial [Brachyspira catarrhinii]